MTSSDLLLQILQTTSNCWEKYSNATVWRNEIERLFDANVPNWHTIASVVVAGRKAFVVFFRVEFVLFRFLFF